MNVFNHNPRGIRRPRIDYFEVFVEAMVDCDLGIRDALKVVVDRAIIAHGKRPRLGHREKMRVLSLEILRDGCEFYGVPVCDIVVVPRRGRRPAKDSTRRMSIMHAMSIGGVSYSEIQRAMGFASHQPVYNSLDQIDFDKYRKAKWEGEEIYRRAISRELTGGEPHV